MNEDINVYKRRFDREKNARIEAENLLENKSRELYLANEALKNLTADLEKMVGERTAELKTARDLAIANSDAKSLFLANMSHEIRTPMNGILGVLHLLESGALTPHQQRLIATAKNSSELLLAIINDILDVSKIEAGELKLEAIAFDLTEAIETTIDSFSLIATGKNLKLTTHIDPQLPYLVEGDPTRLRQILSNLLSNALKFTEKGGIDVSAQLDDAGLIIISVSDTGIGIPQEKIDSIFSPFTQADESITRKFGGTGLGLAICSHLSKVMGKKIQVTSELNKGSQFTFGLKLPVIQKDRPYVTACQEAMNSFRILACLEQQNDASAVASYLKRLAFQRVDYCVDFKSAYQAITQAKRHAMPYSLLIIDNRDLEIKLEAIKQNNLLEGVKVALVRAAGSPTLSQGARKLLDAQLTYPLSLCDFCNALIHLVQPEAQVHSDHIPKITQPAWRFDHYRIMLVDDNPVNREIGSEILRAHGLIVECFEDGKKALEAATKENYDAILMDIQMPVMDGLTAAKHIRALGGQYKELPIIAMTAHAQSEDIQKSLDAGMNSHLSKPIQPEQIFSNLSRWLKPSAALDATTTAPTENQKTEDTLPTIAGLDVEAGLSRANNNKALLKKVLISFANTHKDDKQKLLGHYQAQDFSALEGLAHKIKGSAATIGAKELAKSAGVLEAVCKEKNFSQCPELISKTNHQLDLLLNSLQQLFITTTHTETKTLTQEELEQKIALFIELSKTDITGAENILNDILAASPETPITQTIKQHFDNFDMDSIYPLLAQLKSNSTSTSHNLGTAQ